MIQKYDSYKSSGIEWLGDIPSHWEVKKLKYISKIKTGEKDTENKVDDGRYPFFVRSDKIEKINSYSFDGEAVLTAGDGVGVGKVFHYFNGKFEYHQRVYKISNFKSVEGKFFYYYLKENFHKEVLKLSAKSTVDSIRLPMLANFFIAIPSKKEQDAIVNFLDKKCESIDNYILKQKELIELLKEKKSSLINKAVTKGLDSKVEYKDSGIEWLGEIPKHWEIKKLKYICQINKNTLGDKTNPNLEIEYVDIGNVSFENGINTIEKYHFKNAPSRARRIAKNGNTIVSTVRTYLKAITYVDTNASSYVYSTGFAILEPKKYFNNRYFTFMIKSDFFTEQVNINSKGMSYPAINSTDLGNLFLCFPEKKEQNQIVEYIEKESSKIDDAISHIEDEIKLLEEYKQSLISSAVTGKIKLF